MFSLSHGPGFKGRMCGFHYQATYNASLESKWLQNYTFFTLNYWGNMCVKKATSIIRLTNIAVQQVSSCLPLLGQVGESVWRQMACLKSVSRSNLKSCVVIPEKGFDFFCSMKHRLNEKHRFFLIAYINLCIFITIRWLGKLCWCWLRVRCENICSHLRNRRSEAPAHLAVES